MNDILDGLWLVNESGYEVIEDVKHSKITEESSPFPVSKDGNPHNLEKMTTCPHLSPIDKNSTLRSYKLMDHPGLFFEFSELKGNEQIIAFANKYGLLETFRENESVSSFWVSKILTMRFYISIINLIRKNAPDDDIKEVLRNHVAPLYIRDIIEKDGIFFEERMCKIYLESDGRFQRADYKLSKIDKNGISYPKNLKEAVYHYVSWDINVHLDDALTFRTNVDKWNKGLEISLQPKNLISALWLQLSYYVSNNLEFKQCVECTNYFEVKLKPRKNERSFCSDRCRVRVGARKRRAKEKLAKENNS